MGFFKPDCSDVLIYEKFNEVESSESNDPVEGTPRRYPLSTIPQKALRMGAIVPDSSHCLGRVQL